MSIWRVLHAPVGTCSTNAGIGVTFGLGGQNGVSFQASYGQPRCKANGGLSNRLSLVQAQQIEENRRQAGEDQQVASLVGN